MTTFTRPHLTGPRGRRVAGLIATLTMTVAISAACSANDTSSDTSDSSSSGSSSSSAGDRSVPSAPESPESPQSPQSPESPESSDSGARSSGQSGSDASGDTQSTSAARPPAVGRLLISNGTVSLVSDDVATARRNVQRIVDAQQGTVTEENTDTDDEGVAIYSRLVVRVPSASFKATVEALEKAAELRQSQKSSEDVTTQVLDTDVRVRAQQSSLRRVEELLARADSLKDIIWIESQLTSRQADLDSLKSQQAWLADQTSESTITIDIEKQSATKPVEEDTEGPAGFVGGLKGGMNALGAFAAALATIVGALLPFAIVMVVLGVPIWMLARRSARRRTPKQPATTTP